MGTSAPPAAPSSPAPSAPSAGGGAAAAASPAPSSPAPSAVPGRDAGCGIVRTSKPTTAVGGARTRGRRTICSVRGGTSGGGSSGGALVGIGGSTLHTSAYVVSAPVSALNRHNCGATPPSNTSSAAASPSPSPSGAVAGRDPFAVDGFDSTGGGGGSSLSSSSFNAATASSEVSSGASSAAFASSSVHFSRAAAISSARVPFATSSAATRSFHADGAAVVAARPFEGVARRVAQRLVLRL